MKHDIEQALADILQEEIWREITATTGKTRQDLDNLIIAQIMKLSDIKKQIIIVCGKICSGKGHFCTTNYPGYHQIQVSTVVKRLAKTDVRSELGQTASLDQQIADAIIEETHNHSKVIIDGVRQKSILERLKQELGSQIVDIIWLDVPEETLRTRFASRKDSKDDMDFDKAIASDVALGLSDVEQSIRQSGRVVTH